MAFGRKLISVHEPKLGHLPKLNADSDRIRELEAEVLELKAQNESLRSELSEVKAVNTQLLRTCQSLRSSQLRN